MISERLKLRDRFLFACIKELKNLGITVSFLILNRYQGEEDILSGLEGKYHDSRVIKLAKQDREVTGLEMLEAIDLPVEISEI